jgi:SAM-dependent methyltransferase
VSNAESSSWHRAEHAVQYLERADTIPHRTEGEAALLEWLPGHLSRVLDLGSGDGRLLATVMPACRVDEGVALDVSAVMLDRLRARFGSNEAIRIVGHDMAEPLPADLGTFDAVVSSFSIHHLSHVRKRALYEEVHQRLRPGGVFCNLEHVASPTTELHRQFLAAIDVRPEDEDPSNQLLDVETQLAWLRAIGFVDADCHWKWRELALLAGRRI